jgi:hypothetical protein
MDKGEKVEGTRNVKEREEGSGRGAAKARKMKGIEK